MYCRKVNDPAEHANGADRDPMDGSRPVARSGGMRGRAVAAVLHPERDTQSRAAQRDARQGTESD